MQQLHQPFLVKRRRMNEIYYHQSFNIDTISINKISLKYNCNLSITLLRFHKYVIFGDNAFKKSIENEIKKKIKNKRKNDIQQSIIDVKTHIIKKNDREDRMKKRKMQ